MIIVDTGVLYSFFVADDPDHLQAKDIVTSPHELIIVSPLVIAEIDYFILRRFGPSAEKAMLLELSQGLYEIGPPPVSGPGLVRVAGYLRWVQSRAYSIGVL